MSSLVNVVLTFGSFPESYSSRASIAAINKRQLAKMSVVSLTPSRSGMGKRSAYDGNGEIWCICLTASHSKRFGSIHSKLQIFRRSGRRDPVKTDHC